VFAGRTPLVAKLQQIEGSRAKKKRKEEKTEIITRIEGCFETNQ